MVNTTPKRSVEPHYAAQKSTSARFSARAVTAVLRSFGLGAEHGATLGSTLGTTDRFTEDAANGAAIPLHELAARRWLEAVAALVCTKRPDLAPALLDALQVEAFDATHNNPLAGLSIGEIGVCYEALLATIDPSSRKGSGQFFTPDDAASFMASQAAAFPTGMWLDPCCGVGNLAWHLANAQADATGFVRGQLTLLDRDPIALATAVALIAADFLAPGDLEGVRLLHARSTHRDFLSPAPLPACDFIIANPPYARIKPRDGFATAASKESFALFMERIATQAQGFVAVTPASYVSSQKFATLREILLSHQPHGDVLVFDNVPDTLFRGYKFGSSNTSTTNFVRAAITVCAPSPAKPSITEPGPNKPSAPPASHLSHPQQGGQQTQQGSEHTQPGWRITPILRWKVASRKQMFRQAPSLLAPMFLGPQGQWVKLPLELAPTWQWLRTAPRTLADLLSPQPTRFSLTVALTPRYFISAAYRPLQRRSKQELFFRTAADRDLAALVLNSAIAYIWWRALDGGVTLTHGTLRSIPIPADIRPNPSLAAQLRNAEESSLVTKLNAGVVNENIKHPPALSQRVNKWVFPDAIPPLARLYTEDMFSA